MRWRQSFCCFGQLRSVCVFAWILYLTVPGLYFWLVLPSLNEHYGRIYLNIGFLIYALTTICFIGASCLDPGVAAETEMIERTSCHAHPGNEYSLSRDSNRYVRGFDHFCEFVGNDIGRGNMPCFVAFLLLLACFSTYVVFACGLSFYLGWLPPPPTWHFSSDWTRYLVAVSLLVPVLWALRKCTKSEHCSGVGSLIMMMPGAGVGAVMLLIVLAATTMLPIVSDIFTNVSPQHNATSFFLLLPVLGFAVLFWGMSIHWITLFGAGISQKFWLKEQGLSWGSKGKARAASARDLV